MKWYWGIGNWELGAIFEYPISNSQYHFLPQSYNFVRMENYSKEQETELSEIHSPTQILLFMGAVIFLCMMLGSGIIMIACNIQEIDFQDTVATFSKDSTSPERNFMRGALLINHTLSFLIPALLTGWLFFRSKWSSVLGVRKCPFANQLGLGVLLTVLSFPLAQVAFMTNRWVVEKIPFLQSMVESETNSENLMEGLLVMSSPFEMLFSLLVMAVIPAIGEEMVFRGILQKQLQRIIANPYIAILATALIFSLAHFQVQRFSAIFLLGIVLGLLFYWTKNLWVPIAGHFIFNGTQVIAAYFSQDQLDQLNANQEVQIPFAVTAFALVAFIFVAKKIMENEKW